MSILYTLYDWYLTGYYSGGGAEASSPCRLGAGLASDTAQVLAFYTPGIPGVEKLRKPGTRYRIFDLRECCTQKL